MIPGWLVAMVTFPGVIVHEAAHMLFCRLRGVAVLDVCFFRVGNPAGYVIHEQIENFNTSFLVCVGPLFVNTGLCFVLCFPSLIPMRIFDHSDPMAYFMLWLGVSIGMHAFPSTQDASNLWTAAVGAAKRLNPLALVSFPLVVLVYAANVLSFFWFDYFYGLGVGVGLPMVILEKMT